MDATATLIGIARLAQGRANSSMLGIVNRKRPSPGARTMERDAGLLTVPLGVGGGAIAAFAPLASNESCEAGAGGRTACRSWSSSLWQDERGVALALVAVVAALSLAVAGAALAGTNEPPRRAALFCATAALAALAVLGLASVGLFILPSALAAVVASVAALRGSKPATSNF